MRKTLLDGFTRYFYFSLQDRKGIILLSAICLLTYLMPIFIRHYAEKSKPTTDFAEERNLVQQLAQSELLQADASATPIAVSLFLFDPNTTTVEEFMRLGLSAKTAQTIENYRTKGGKFRKPEDFAKIWSVTKEDYDRLLPYIEIQDNKPIAGEYRQGKAEQLVTLMAFDPNTADEATFVKLGLPPHTIKSILNYRSKGGKFKTGADLKKIYTLSEKDFTRLAPYITIESAKKDDDLLPVMASNNSGRKYSDAERSFGKSVVIDINTADELEWQKLKGIGPALSKRIASYRNNLGGFYTIEQVAETYNLPDSTYQSIKSQLKLTEPAQLKKININQAREEELVVHPYIGKKEAKWITAYRQQHGNYRSVDDVLKAFPKEDSKWLAKVRKYLEI